MADLVDELRNEATKADPQEAEHTAGPGDVRITIGLEVPQGDALKMVESARIWLGSKKGVVHARIGGVDFRVFPGKSGMEIGMIYGAVLAQREAW